MPSLRAGPRNLITDVLGLKVGNAADDRALTGVTVLRPDAPCTAAVDVRGGGPGTRETDLLAPAATVDRIDALVFAGGSVFGLDAASAVTAKLAARGQGLVHRDAVVPIVPAAICFDLHNGGDKNWGETPPYAALGRAALEDVSADIALGNVGAGMGATAGPLKGGLGSASVETADGDMVGALAVVNAAGHTTVPDGPQFWAWPFELGGEFGGLAPPAAAVPPPVDIPAGPVPANTTLVAVAVNRRLDKLQAQRIAIMAQDGLARAIRPAHTPFDGDIVFVLGVGERGVDDPREVARLGTLAGDCTARAIARGVYEAVSLGGMPGYRDVWGDGRK